MRLEKIAKIYQGIPLSRIRISPSDEIEEKKVYSFETEEVIEIPKNHANQNIPEVEEGMILVNLTSYKAKKIEKADLGKIIPSNYIIVEVYNESIVDPNYLEWYIDKSNEFKRELNKIKQGTSIRSIPISEFRKIRIELPAIDFQVKIGKINNLNKIRKNYYKERDIILDDMLRTINEGEKIND